MNIKDIIFDGVVYSIMGVCVVFLILLIIMYVIKAMALFAVDNSAKKTVEKEPQEKPVIQEIKKETDDTELIAVITAAIAASMGKSTSGLIVRSYKKISGGAWNKAGRTEILDNRY